MISDASTNDSNNVKCLPWAWVCAACGGCTEEVTIWRCTQTRRRVRASLFLSRASASISASWIQKLIVSAWVPWARRVHLELHLQGSADGRGWRSWGEGELRPLLARYNSSVNIRIYARQPFQFFSAGSVSASKGVVPSGSSATVLTSTRRSWTNLHSIFPSFKRCMRVYLSFLAHTWTILSRNFCGPCIRCLYIV